MPESSPLSERLDPPGPEDARHAADHPSREAAETGNATASGGAPAANPQVEDPGPDTTSIRRPGADGVRSGSTAGRATRSVPDGTPGPGHTTGGPSSPTPGGEPRSDIEVNSLEQVKNPDCPPSPPTERIAGRRTGDPLGDEVTVEAETPTATVSRPAVADDATAKFTKPTRAAGAGRVIGGRYRLDQVLGRGSMGTVWAGHDEMLGRSVAVKEVSPHPGLPAGEAELIRQRTLREARSIAVLSHPNVITLFDVVVQDGSPFVVMELMPAPSLADLIHQRGPLTTTQAAVIGHAVASGLRAAHRAGITHRDVKPGNVLVGPDGRVKLTDFGIARNVADLTLTGTGLMLGSPAYIAPEVASGRGTSPAADAWGLGATLFAAVEARPPYDVDGDPVATVGAVVSGPIPVPERAGPLGPVIAALMTKDPARRMTVDQARGRLAPFITDAGSRIFAPVADSVPTVRGIPREQLLKVGASLPVRRHIPDSTPLATDPGPLPFGPGVTAPAPRPPVAAAVATRWWRAVLLLVVAFTVTLLIGFLAARLITGEPLNPMAGASTATGDESARLRQHTEVAARGPDGPGGRFAVVVPENWEMFREQRPDSVIGASTLIHYVAPDSGRMITIERFAGFYPKNRIAQYTNALRRLNINNGSDYTPEEIKPLPERPVSGPETPQELTYRTLARSDDGAGDSAPRTTYAWLVPHRGDLWVLRMTMPSEQDKSGRAQFNRIAGSLSLLD